MTSFVDSKYDVDNETAQLASTVELFPDMAQFATEPINPSPSPNPMFSNWSLLRIGTLRSRLEAMQHRNDTKGFRHNSNILDSLSSGQVYGLANEVFGYDGWSTTIMHYEEILADFDEEKDRFSLRGQATVRIFLRDGFYHDHTGVGEAINLPFKYMCYSKCKKQAATDATKRAIVALSDMHPASESIKHENDS